MAKDQPVETTEQLAQYLASGVKPKDQWKIGTEHEKFVFCRTSFKPAPYDGETGLKEVRQKS